MIKVFFIILWGLLFTCEVYAQQQNPEIRRGNRAFSEENFTDAERHYRNALEADPQDTRALFNLSNALYRQQRYDEAANILEGLSQMQLPDEQKADVHHNLGNAQLGKNELKKGIDSYKNALRIRPEDNDTRHNLAYALQQLQEQEQQQQQDQDQQDDEQQQDEEQDQEHSPDQEPDDEPRQEQQRPDQISPEDAERILDALNQKEQEIQEEIEREEKQTRPFIPERQW